jgi:thiamine transport system substrate-binding protein
LTVTPGWSESYGLLTSGEAPMVLSYTTSPAYHLIAERDERYAAVEFSEGHYIQIEVAGITAKGADNPLAAQFMAFMTGPGFQDVIPETNWMFPAGATTEPLNPVFSDMIRPETPLTIDAEQIAENRKAWIDEWLSVMSR